MLHKVSDSERKIISSCLLNRTAYNIPLFIKFQKGLDIPKMYNALVGIFEKYSIFRTFYRVEEDILKGVHDSIPTIEIQTFSQFNKKDLCEKHLISIEDNELVKVVICKVLNEECDYMFINVHHALLDGFSINLFLQGLLTNYLYNQPVYFEELSSTEDMNRNNKQNESVFLYDSENYEKFKLKLTSKQAECINYMNERMELLEQKSQRHSDFAICLLAFSISIAQWLNHKSIYMAYPFLGRNAKNYKSLGNFVNFIPFHYNFGDRKSEIIEDIIAEFQKNIFSSFTNYNYGEQIKQKEHMKYMNIFNDIIFDYKSGSLIEKVLNEENEIFLEESTMYRDEKYGMHFVVYQNNRELEINIISNEYESEELKKLMLIFQKNIQALYDRKNVQINELLDIKEIAEEVRTDKDIRVISEYDAIYEAVIRMVSSLVGENLSLKENDSFFDIGMDSLLLVKFKKKIKETFNVNLKISDFFNNYTTELLTKKIMDKIPEGK